MKYTILFIIAFWLLVSCSDKNSLTNNPDRFNRIISLYEQARREILANKSLFLKDVIYAQDLKTILENEPEHNLENLRKLMNQGYLEKNKISVIIDYKNNTFDFYFKSTESGFLTKMISGRKENIDYIISYDPTGNWKEVKSIVGVTNDVQISELLELKNNWYYVKYWTAE